MIAAAIVTLKERKGSSRPAIKKYILENYKVSSDLITRHFNIAIRKGTEKGVFKFENGKQRDVFLRVLFHLIFRSFRNH
jgi:histone H1/5